MPVEYARGRVVFASALGEIYFDRRTRILHLTGSGFFGKVRKIPAEKVKAVVIVRRELLRDTTSSPVYEAILRFSSGESMAVLSDHRSFHKLRQMAKTLSFLLKADYIVSIPDTEVCCLTWAQIGGCIARRVEEKIYTIEKIPPPEKTSFVTVQEQDAISFLSDRSTPRKDILLFLLMGLALFLLPPAVSLFFGNRDIKAAIFMGLLLSSAPLALAGLAARAIPRTKKIMVGKGLLRIIDRKDKEDSALLTEVEEIEISRRFLFPVLEVSTAQGKLLIGDFCSEEELPYLKSRLEQEIFEKTKQ